MLNYDSLRTPREDGAVLVEPPPEKLPALAMANRDAAARWSGGVGQHDWSRLRREVRRGLGIPDDGPVIMTGHQPEFIHPGVWAKHVMTQRIARAVGGAAVNLVVDNDAVKMPAIRIPFARGDRVQLAQVELLEQGVGRPYEFLPALSRDRWRAARERTAALMGRAFDDSLMAAFFDAASQARGDFVEQVVAGRKAAERLLGVELHEARVSAVWGGPMPADWIVRAREFAAAYNAALASYRRSVGIRDPRRPVPDLEVDDARVELPLWAYRPGRARCRVYAERRGATIRIYAQGEQIAEVASDVPGSAGALTGPPGGPSGWVIRPRALTLTLWARLLACDLFVHGIGGAIYDRITDEIIRRFYGIEPPRIVCVSATLRVPLPGVCEADVAGARAWMRAVRYQPQLWAGAFEDVRPLLRERWEAIERSDRLRREQPDAHADRRRTWARIRELNDLMLAGHRHVLREARERLARAEDLAAQKAIAEGREYFFALYPRERLLQLCRKLPDVA